MYLECQECNWQGDEADLEDGKCPYCGSAETGAVGEVNEEEEDE